MKYCKLFFLLFLAIIGFQSCKTVKNTKMVNAETLQGKWILSAYNSSAVENYFKGKIPTIEFNISEGRVFGNGGCNTYSGSYNLDGNRFSVPNAVSTMMACIFDNKESEFLKILADTSILSLQGERLIMQQGGKDVLVFIKQPAPSASLLNGEWTLMSIEGTSANIHFQGQYPTINFNATENRVYGNAGCNTYSGEASFNGNTMEVNKIITTRMACQNMEGENKFVNLLSGTNDIELDENQLILKNGGSEKLRFLKQ